MQPTHAPRRLTGPSLASLILAAMILVGCAGKAPVRTDSFKLLAETAWYAIWPAASGPGHELVLNLEADESYSLYIRSIGHSEAYTIHRGGYQLLDGRLYLRDAAIRAYDQEFSLDGDWLRLLRSGGLDMDAQQSAAFQLQRFDPSILDYYWRLTMVAGQRLEDNQTGRPAYVIFSSQDRRLGGNSGCNQFTAGFQLGPHFNLRLSALAATKMACPDMSIEYALFNALTAASGYVPTPDGLSLIDEGGKSLARFLWLPEAPF